MPALQQRPAKATIQLKLLGLILLTVAVATVTLSTYFLQIQVRALHGELSRKANAYASLMSVQVRSAIAFRDIETAREVFDSVVQDPVVQGVGLFTEEGDLLYSYGELGEAAQAARGGVATTRSFLLPGSVLVAAPVRSLEGPTGTLVVELSTSEVLAGKRAIQLTAMAIAGVVLLLGALLAFWIARSFTKRLRAVAAVAREVAEGHLDQPPLRDPSRDEIGVLASGVDLMTRRLRSLIADMRKQAQDEQVRLEAEVAARTMQLRTRNADMRRVLEQVGQGFLSIDDVGRMSPEYSSVLETWFGDPKIHDTLWSYLQCVVPELGRQFENNWEQVVAGILPLELTLAQMPCEFSASNHYYEIAYHPVGRQGERFQRMFIIISDVTARVERERAEADEREIAQLCSALLRDREGLVEFFGEARQQLSCLCSHLSDPEERMRAAHTLKGNAALFGMNSVSQLCHEAETALQQEMGYLSAPIERRLQERFEHLTARFDALMGATAGRQLMLSEDELTELIHAVDDPEAMRLRLAALRLEPSQRRLERAARQARALARRLGKGEIDVVLEHNRLRLDSVRMKRFWAAFAHAIRNAVDHGLQTPALRETVGKVGTGRITLRTTVTPRHLHIEIEDDGGTVDWAVVRELARARGLSCGNQEQLSAALFFPGFSTQKQVSDTSGRGVGLSALHDACTELGGTVHITSHRCEYTRLTFQLPRDLAIDPRDIDLCSREDSSQESLTRHLRDVG